MIGYLHPAYVVGEVWKATPGDDLGAIAGIAITGPIGARLWDTCVTVFAERFRTKKGCLTDIREGRWDVTSSSGDCLRSRVIGLDVR